MNRLETHMPNSPTKSPIKLDRLSLSRNASTSQSSHIAGPSQSTSPPIQRTKSKGKERPSLGREIGSATISLRQEAVDGLVIDNEPVRPSGFEKRKTSSKGKDLSTPLHVITPPRNRRIRSNSVRLPETPGIIDPDGSFFLPHYSTDEKFSLPTSTPRVDLELGLGDDFDFSFGEAMRRGAGGEEMPLPKEALRVLNQAKENTDIKLLGKTGRKGSLGMGLFKETRAGVAAIRDRKIREEGLEEHAVEEDIPPTPVEIAKPATAAIHIASPIPRNHSPARRKISSHYDEDSGWTTTSSEHSVSASSETGSEAQKSDISLETEEDERMTVPLQPFNHAVGGHSSIYKFTRRAVCKPLVSRENLFYEEVERLAPALLAFIPRYLGVMLVNYRKQMKMGTEGSATPIDASPATSHPPTPGGSLQRQTTGLSIASHHDDIEVPEVSLDFNRHVVPDWLFSGRREEDRGRVRGRHHTSDDDKVLRPSSARSQEFHKGSFSPSSSFGHSFLSASPSLRAGSSSPAITVPMIQEDEPSTPHSSPSHFQRSSPLHHTISSPVLPHRGRLDSLFEAHSGSGYNSPHPGFGGTGSTTVNTKLKDHVFATILKRLKKKGIHPHRHDDDADDENDNQSIRSTRRRRCSRRAENSGSMDLRPKGESSDIRRTKSDVILDSRREREQSAERLFEMEEDQLSIKSKRERSSLSGLQPMTKASPTAKDSVPPSPSVHPSDEITRQELFIFMEDLTGRLKHPCVLDLKMGTRQYGYDATPLKKRSQRKKCDTTTSRTLGVRMCGMQSFVSKNKYRGREIKTSDFTRVLRTFLYDGERVLVDHIPVIIQKLHNLAAILLELDGFRFYGCSLLMIYDGEKETQDFFKRHAQAVEDTIEEEDEYVRLKRKVVTDRRSRSADPVNHLRSSSKRLRGEVNIRVVDFAHTTTGQDFVRPSSDYQDPPDLGKGYYAAIDESTGLAVARFPPKFKERPDLGFVFGLKSVAQSLREVWREDGGHAELVVKENADVFDVFREVGKGELST